MAFVDLYVKHGNIRVGHLVMALCLPDGSPDPRCIDDKGVALPADCTNARVTAVEPATYEDRNGATVEGFRVTCDTSRSCCNP